MSREASGKRPIADINFRLMRFFSYVFIPLGLFCLFSAGPIGVLFGWVGWQIGGFVFAVFLPRLAMIVTCDLMNSGNVDYLRWRQAGGDPFYDAPINPCNPDPDTVKMAIGTPPSVTHCVCGQPLGKNFGNRCGVCGRYWDGY